MTVQIILTLKGIPLYARVALVCVCVYKSILITCWPGNVSCAQLCQLINGVIKVLSLMWLVTTSMDGSRCFTHGDNSILRRHDHLRHSAAGFSP